MGIENIPSLNAVIEPKADDYLEAGDLYASREKFYDDMQRAQEYAIIKAKDEAIAKMIDIHDTEIDFQ